MSEKFVQGNWAEDEEGLYVSHDDDEEQEVYGSFEDLEGEADDSEQASSVAEAGVQMADAEERALEKMTPEQIRARKERKKSAFDAMYDAGEQHEEAQTFFESVKADVNETTKRTLTEFETLDPEQRALFEGVRAGTYVRIVIENMHCEFVDAFNPAFPVLVGGLQPGEEQVGFLQVRVCAQYVVQQCFARCCGGV